MSFTQLAVVLVGVWLIIESQTTVSDTVTLIFGIVVVVCALFDGSRAHIRRAG